MGVWDWDFDLPHFPLSQLASNLLVWIHRNCC